MYSPGRRRLSVKPLDIGALLQAVSRVSSSPEGVSGLPHDGLGSADMSADSLFRRRA